jgi:hypothetical protein
LYFFFIISINEKPNRPKSGFQFFPETGQFVLRCA